MTPKYKIGEEVWTITDNYGNFSLKKLKIIGIQIDEKSIAYKLKDLNYLRLEQKVHKTKKGLINNLFKTQLDEPE